jgi:hypothetical protein
MISWQSFEYCRSIHSKHYKNIEFEKQMASPKVQLLARFSSSSNYRDRLKCQLVHNALDDPIKKRYQVTLRWSRGACVIAVTLTFRRSVSLLPIRQLGSHLSASRLWQWRRQRQHTPTVLSLILGHSSVLS